MSTGFWDKPLVHYLKIVVPLAFVLNGVELLAEWYAVSPVGHGGNSLLAMAGWLNLPLLMAILALPVSLFALLFRRRRRHALIILVCCAVYTVIGIPIDLCSWPIRRAGFTRMVEQSRPLIAAIDKYTKDNGPPPKSLEDLVPRYVSSVPTTGMPAYGRYRYVRVEGNEIGRWDGNPWVLYVDVGTGFNFDRFMYFPMQNYPENGYGGVLERIGDWAYVHE